METVITTILSILGTLGGWEAVKYFLNRKTNARKAEAEADSVEFGVLKEAMEFLENELKEKEERFVEQTNQVRDLNKEVIQLTQEKAKLELDLFRYRCVVEHCPNRQPQNGY